MSIVATDISISQKTVHGKPILGLSKDKRAMAAIANPLMIQRELNNRSLYQFLIWAWPEISGHPFIDNWHIPYLCDVLEKVAYQVGERRLKENDVLINVPPGSTKTIICSIVFPVWCWTKWYWMRFITASYSSTLSLESAEYSRDLIKSTRFKELYPELDIKSDKDTKTNYKIVKKIPSHVNPHYNKELLGGNRYSTSVGGTLTGFHGDILIWDDPINPQQAFSDIQLEIGNKWIDQTLPTRKTDKEVSVVIGIMQRLHQDDPSGHLLAKNKENLKHICLPGEINGAFRKLVKPRSLIKKYTDNLFDARRLPLNVLNELQVDLGQYGYAGQIGQSPAPAGGGMFKVDNFQIITEIVSRLEIIRTVRYWDKAGSVGKGAFTVGVKMSLLKSGKFFVQDVQRGQWSSEKRESHMKQTAEVDGFDCFVVVEQEPGSGGLESAQNSIRTLAGFLISADRPTGDKETRADPFSVQVNSGNVLLQSAGWNKVYMDEFELFPNSTYKDQVDGSSGAFNFLVKKKDVRRWR